MKLNLPGTDYSIKDSNDQRDGKEEIADNPDRIPLRHLHDIQSDTEDGGHHRLASINIPYSKVAK